VSCRRMLSVEDRAAIMVGLEAGLSQVRIARSIEPSPSVVCAVKSPATGGPGGVYKAQDADRAADCQAPPQGSGSWTAMKFVRRRVIADLSQGRMPRQTSGRGHRAGEVRTFARKRKFNTSPWSGDAGNRTPVRQQCNRTSPGAVC